MRAIILAAGQGTRLRPLTDDRPKCMVELAGRPLIAHILETLDAAGVDEVTIVSGYRADQLENLGVELRHNADFATTNMVHSLFCAEADMQGDILISYADIVYGPHFVASLRAGSDIATVTDTEWRGLWEMRMDEPLEDAESLILDANSYIVELGRKPESLDDIQGQYVGLTLVPEQRVDTFRRYYHSLVEQDASATRAMYMTDFLQGLIETDRPVRAARVDGGWLEVDSVEDLRTYERALAVGSAHGWRPLGRGSTT